MQPIPVSDKRRNIIFLIITSICMLGLLIRGAYLAITGALYFDQQNVTSLAANVLDALAMLFCAGLFLPVLVFTIKRLKGQEILPVTVRLAKPWQVLVLVLTWILIVIIGAVLASRFSFGWAVAAPLFLLGISLPILFIIWIYIGGLASGSPRRLWSVFGYGMVGGTVAATILEYLIIGLAAAAITVIAVSNPELRTLIEQIKTRVTNANSGDIQALLNVLAPYITNPLIILAILIFAAILAPVIEETVKPAVIWFFGKHLRSPAEGFVLGALCGAGFAMMEGLLAASGATQMWGFGLAGRAAASLMHITSSGLLGWGIASAQLEKRYKRLALTYFGSVCLHGLWNGSTIVAVYGALRMMTQNMQIDFLGGLFMLGGLGMLFLELILLITALPMINRRLRLSTIPVFAKVQSDIIAPPASSNSRETNGLDP